MRKLSLFIATSLDGYIVQTNDDLSFLKMVEKEGEDYGYAEFTDTIDTLIMVDAGTLPSKKINTAGLSSIKIPASACPQFRTGGSCRSSCLQ